MTPQQLPFAEIVFFDFEFDACPGERPRPVCLVYRELRSGKLVRVWRDQLLQLSAPPYRMGPDVLHVAYYASAEVGCHLALGWPVPTHVLDLFAEFRTATNGRPLSCGSGLLGAATHFGVATMTTDDKDRFRALAQQGTWTSEEQVALLKYCQADVDVLEQLLPHLVADLSEADLGRALLRGRYMVAAARMEHTGIPIDLATLERLRAGWEEIKLSLIDAVDRDFDVYEGTSFSSRRFETWLSARNIGWPRTATGSLALDDGTFKDLAKSYPELEALRQLRHALGQLRLNDLAVGADARNRTLLSAFRSATSRNQPSNTRFIFGPAVWLRSLIRAEPGHGLVYIDYEQQEFAIAAALSRDPGMLLAYESGDPYLSFAVQAGAAPVGATKASHREVRERFKACALGVLFGMGEKTLAARIGGDSSEAGYLLELHRRTFPRYWSWSEASVDRAMLTGRARTVFGWQLHVGPGSTAPSLMNFPMQSHGAEILRLACILATELGVELCAPVHDALLIHARSEDLHEHVEVTRAAMSWASAVVLGGLEIRTDTKTIHHPARYDDERGHAMWSRVMGLLDDLDRRATARSSCNDAPPHSLLSSGSSSEEAA